MTLLIDCYNLLHTTMPPSLAGLDEARLCHLLARRPTQRGRTVVVCDGVVKPDGPTSSPAAAVELVYCGPGGSADDWIVQLVNRDSAPRSLTVVSNDRAIQKAVRRRRAAVRTCEQMVHRLAQLAARPTPASAQQAPKPAEQPLTDAQVRRWSRAFGLDPNAPIDDQPF